MVSAISQSVGSFIGNLSRFDKGWTLINAALCGVVGAVVSDHPAKGLFTGLVASVVTLGILAFRNLCTAQESSQRTVLISKPSSGNGSIGNGAVTKIPSFKANLTQNYYEIDRIPIQIPSLVQMDVHLRGAEGHPPAIRWSGNSCFVSSTMWAGILNEPTILNEIPLAILRRLSAFKSGLDQATRDSKLDEKGLQSVLEIGALLGENRRLVKGDLIRLCQTLKQLDDSKNPYRVKELLSLLELYCIVDECQTNGSVGGQRLNELRQSAHRINSTFQGIETRIGDADELFKILADLVFDGSRWNQELITTQFVHDETLRLHPEVGNSETGELRNQPKQSNWGRFELVLQEGASVRQALKNSFDEFPESVSVSCKAQGWDDLMPFTLRKKTNRLQFAPPFMALTIKRADDTLITPIHAEPFFELEGRHFIDGNGGTYELYGVCRCENRHYVADIKRDQRNYHCNDISEQSVSNSYQQALQNSANRGYVLFYRKVT